MTADAVPPEVRHCAVLGDPIAHSLSPVLHRAAFAELGLAWEYDACRVASGGLPEFLAGLDARWRGLSLTMPLKREVTALADSLTPRARAAGAANTLLLEDGRHHGDNTDVPGARAALAQHGITRVTRAVVLGAGATATSVGLALTGLGVREIVLVVRDASRAGETVQALRAVPEAPDVRVEETLETPGDGPCRADLVVSTVPAGAQHPALLARLAEVPALFEVVYDPWPTPLAAAAGERPLVTGLDLLVQQAALQCELFTGREAPVAAMQAAGRAALAASPEDAGTASSED